MVEPIVLALVVVVAVLAALTVFSRNAISSAFSLVLMMVGLAAIYGVSGAHFIAALQAIVYAGAIMVLFVFSIMLLNMEENKSEFRLFSLNTMGAGIFCLVVFGSLSWAFIQWSGETRLPAAGTMTLEQIREVGGNVVAVSAQLFSAAYLQFEFISLLLLVAIACALVLAKRKVD